MERGGGEVERGGGGEGGRGGGEGGRGGGEGRSASCSADISFHPEYCVFFHNPWIALKKKISLYHYICIELGTLIEYIPGDNCTLLKQYWFIKYWFIKYGLTIPLCKGHYYV